MYIYLNGKVVSKEEAVISPYDHGFMYGVGAFETFRTYDGFPFLIDEHLYRLHEALHELNIRLELDSDKVIKMVQTLLSRNEMSDAYFRLNVSGGAGDIGLQTETYEEPTVILYTKPLVQTDTVSEKELILLKTVRNTPEGEKRLKSHHYLNSILGKRELSDVNQEGVFLTKEGYISEGTVSNLFWVKQNQVFTPGTSTGILEGITRKWVMNVSESLNIPLKTGNYKIEELVQADEVFLTNSIQELVPVKRFEHKVFPGAEGEVFQSYLSLYKAHTKEKRRTIDVFLKG
ncbi:aminodeoxychorismate lyase [Fictibacillus barbaricus]|uniref:Aminodeoxychorismate lyase n=1 Tax=Fictibacillus barbaricus TaxID=182136 RepID=A0ABS2Z7B1_9BACL|nr:aminodeoxychorismate lyase [Fictibacillus barbaricus]MBN3543803.1 aminodeoxychorismate lyase [Fictibacillus barbaricus]GGB71104.1 4-amino-4-deoxychorismate lyase [Fictibacillus barbaricus]